jgi:transcriptional regulator with XRE-family HTH domain
MSTYEKFENLMEERGVKPYRVHKDTGIATGTLSDWKNGKSEPKRDKIELLSKYFGVPITYFYGTEDKDEKNTSSWRTAPGAGKKDFQLIKNYHKLDEEGQLLVDMLIAKLLKK